MPARPLAPAPATVFAAVLAAALNGASAQPAAPGPATESRITQVKVYAGSATVERVARVAAGTQAMTFACLPALLDVQSLQVTADAAVRLGETSVLSEARAGSARCTASTLDAPIRELEDQKAALQAEADALSLVTGYLKGLSPAADDPQGRRNVADPKNLAAMADVLRRTGQDALLRQYQIMRRQADIDRQLDPLKSERSRVQAAGGNVVSVTVALEAKADAEVRLSYQVSGPGWSPAYRALLDTTTRRVRIERQALVAQATGEDWHGVKLVLSTGQPRRETAGRVPRPWRMDLLSTPMPTTSVTQMAMAAPAAPVMAGVETRARVRAEPLFDIDVSESPFATEFSVPRFIDIPSNGQRVALTLGEHEDGATVVMRTTPRLDASAFVVADMARPAGVWPAGPLRLYRDGNYVGVGRWDTDDEPRLTLSFGRDERVRVEVEPEQQAQGTAGFVGTRSERTTTRAYVIENRHPTPIAVQVLEAAPVRINEQIQVTAQFTPQPSELKWHKEPGVAMWAFNLGANGSARVTAAYAVTYPKDLLLDDRQEAPSR